MKKCPVCRKEMTIKEKVMLRGEAKTAFECTNCGLFFIEADKNPQDLISQSLAAEILGTKIQYVSQRIKLGTLRGFSSALTTHKAVSRAEVERLKEFLLKKKGVNG